MVKYYYNTSRSVFVRSSIGSRSVFDRSSFGLRSVLVRPPFILRSSSVRPSIVLRSRIEDPSNRYQSINGLLTERLPTYNDIVANT